MSILHQQRQDILLNDNTAQQRFEEILEQNGSDSTISIHMALNGDLDLSLMKNDKYKHIEELVFSEGYITSIEHIPTGIKKLTIAKNILISLDNLPQSLTFLDFCENEINSIDLSYLKNLEVLRCSDNKMEELILPKGLKELNIENNDIKHLNARDFPQLKNLNIKDNSLLIIDNINILSLDVFQTHNNPLINAGTNDTIEEQKENEDKVDYIESLNKYFQFKGAYDKDSKKRCIKCRRKTGTIFSSKDFYYTAICGSKTDPCKLNIKLYRGEFGVNDDLVVTLKEFMEKDKEDIIKQKMDTIFSYISEDESVKLFENKMQTYTENSDLYKISLNDYNNVVDNFEKKKKISDKTHEYHSLRKSMKSMLQEYKESNNKQLLKDAMKLYVDELKPVAQLLQSLKYPLMEIVNDFELHQYELTNSDREVSFAEPPKVEKFIV